MAQVTMLPSLKVENTSGSLQFLLPLLSTAYFMTYQKKLETMNLFHALVHAVDSTASKMGPCLN